jgi:hypothetical protein
MKKDFQTSWNNHFFRTDLPYYQAYRNVCDAGADFDYIRCLHRCIESADSLDTPASGERTNLKKVRKKIRALLENKNILAPVVECFGFTAALHAAVTTQEALRKDPSDPVFSRRDSSLVEECEQMAQKAGRMIMKKIIEWNTGDRETTEGWPIALRREYINALSNLIKRPFSWVEQSPDFPVESQPQPLPLGGLLREEIKKRRWSLDPEESLLVLAAIFMDYAGRKIRKTKNPDSCGTFFLLAVTEHLRERSGKPKYLLAARLLKKIRGQSLKSHHQESTTAKSRVTQFQNSSDFADWESCLRTVKKCCLLSSGHRTSRVS